MMLLGLISCMLTFPLFGVLQAEAAQDQAARPSRMGSDVSLLQIAPTDDSLEQRRPKRRERALERSGGNRRTERPAALEQRVGDADHQRHEGDHRRDHPPGLHGLRQLEAPSKGLLTLREARVRNLAITLAPSEQLESCVDSLLADPSLQRLTLVDFRVPYGGRGAWQPEALASVARRARSLGWHQVVLPAGDPSLGVRARSDDFWQRRFPQLPGDPRVLVIASPTKTKYFSE